MFWKNCIYVISVVNFISVHSVYMKFLYIRILTTNKVNRAIKLCLCNLFFCIFMEMLPKFATVYLAGGIWLFCYKCQMHVSTLVSWGVYLMVLSQMSYAHVYCSWWGGGYIQWLCHKCHMCMWTAVVGGSGGGLLEIWIHFGFDSCFIKVFSTKNETYQTTSTDQLHYFCSLFNCFCIFISFYFSFCHWH